MASLLTDLGSVATAIIKEVVVVTTTITDNPLLLFTVGVLFLGSAVGIFGRILGRG